MGILYCTVCKNIAEAKTKQDAITLIDHAAKSKKCSGKDELCEWYPNGIPVVEPDGFIDPKRPIEGISTPAPRKSK